MKKVTELTSAELAELATEAWSAAAQQASVAGYPITGSRDGRRIRYHPDGRIEDLGPVADIPSDNTASPKEKSRRSVA